MQRTLTQYTAVTLAEAIKAYGGGADAVYICGGGAYNSVLMDALGAELGKQVLVASTQALGVAPNRVEALAFAWLGYRFSERQAGNLPAVTGARGERVLGALYPR